MAVPSSGELSMMGIHNELAVNNYASTKTPNDVSLEDLSDGTKAAINLVNLPHNRPDESAPHAMSEFYAYDQNNDFPGLFADDWEDGDIGTGARDTFHERGFELAENGDLSESELDDSFAEHSATVAISFDDRPAWTVQSTGHSTVFLDTDNDIRLRNTNSPQGMWIKTTYSALQWGLALNGTTQAVAYRYRFFMNSTNNKDGIIDIRMNTTNHPNPGISTNTYQIQVRDNADPSPGAIRLAKRATTSVTTLAQSPSTGYTVGTTMDFVFSVHESTTFGNPRTLKVGVGPTTVSTPSIINSYNKLSAIDTTYGTNYGWNFRCPKAMSTPNSTHFHRYNFIYATILNI